MATWCDITEANMLTDLSYTSAPDDKWFRLSILILRVLYPLLSSLLIGINQIYLASHKVSPHFLPKPINGFARRDKLREHLRNWHGNFECLDKGCHRGPGNSFRTEEQLLSHTRTAYKTLQAGCPLPRRETSNTTEAALAVLLDENFEAIHGDYNCELSICGQTQSEFFPYAPKKHLIKDHDISSEAVGLVDALIKAGECALRDSQLVRLGWAQRQRGLQSIYTRKTLIECRSCSLVTVNTLDPSL